MDMPIWFFFLDDGIYHAIDVYLKAHTWLRDSEREQLCRLMNCQKLSLKASSYVAQNERLPLRWKSWFFKEFSKGFHRDSRKHEERLLELEKECSCIRKELHKLTKTKKSLSIFPKRFGFRKKSDYSNPNESNNVNSSSPTDKNPNHESS
ncbi:hypothetical protein P8452_15771 [Trifolium repens]|nr:hypothetical protein P8452_15771 [Trifolium repens]